MEYEFRVIVEKVSVASQDVVKRDTVKIYDIRSPKSILALGLRHEEQISLLTKVQNALLAEQSALIDCGYDTCPNCGQKLKKNGFLPSNFHAVFSDHQLRLQKHRCHNPECNWQSTPTTTTVFGTDIHPDLAKLQCEQGAIFSYRVAQTNLEKINCTQRRINNHTRIQTLTNQVGATLSQATLREPSAQECAAPTTDLIVQVDGGHIPVKEKGKRSFEALSAIAYQPDKIKQVDKNHRQITNKTCVVAALNDELDTIKHFVLNAAHRQGMTAQTRVTGLADGAHNCWSVLLSLKSHCLDLECILDWFHIRQKFQQVKNALGESFEESLDSVKWTVWHGEAPAALTKLKLLQDNIPDDAKQSQIQKLHNYLKNNLDYLINYQQRENSEKVYTSQTAESHIDSLINARHKRKQKMQWTREGAHNVLQIRAKMESQEWRGQWQDAVLEALIGAA
ncbi:MAG: hypothetical protein NVS2B14_16910 [Chamaesiphon sp.]